MLIRLSTPRSIVWSQCKLWWSSLMTMFSRTNRQKVNLQYYVYEKVSVMIPKSVIPIHLGLFYWKQISYNTYECMNWFAIQCPHLLLVYFFIYIRCSNCYKVEHDFIYLCMHQNIRKWYYTTSQSADQGVKYNVEHKSANCCDNKAQELFHVV